MALQLSADFITNHLYNSTSYARPVEGPEKPFLLGSVRGKKGLVALALVCQQAPIKKTI